MKSGRAEGARVYFPGLDALRFLAALLVVFTHIEMLKYMHGFQDAAENQSLMELGRIAVTFFFVLSGFLITYLLLVEKRVAGAVSVKKFYVRRILRVWPLYFLVVFLAFFVFPHVPLFQTAGHALLPNHAAYTLPLHVFFLPHVSLLLFPAVPFAEPLWSIGVEEKFYLIWPVLIKHTRKVLALAAGVVVTLFLLKRLAGDMMALSTSPRAQTFWAYVFTFLSFMRFECMAFGAIGAWLFFARKRAVLDALYSRGAQVATYVLTFYFVVTGARRVAADHTLLAIPFTVIILNVATNPRSLLRMEGRLFTFLGAISYGMYMVHIIAIHLSIKLLVGLTGTSFGSARSNLALYAASVTLTLVIATLTYLFYERAFLRLKSRFSILRTGADARAGEEKPATTAAAEATLSTGF